MEKTKKIKVLVVDDSITAREILIGILGSDSDVQLVGEARNGKEAIEMTKRLKPDLITMDIRMPVMDGFEAIKHIMAYYPTPIIVISQSAFSQGDEYIFKALELGALEILEKPEPNEWRDLPKIGEKMLKDIKFLAEVPVITHMRGKQVKDKEEKKSEKVESTSKVITIASSTGGPTALLQVLSKLPKDFSAAVLVVQHIAEGFIESLADWLDNKCAISIKLAEEGDVIVPGVVYISPCDVHMEIEEGIICLSKDPPISSLRPAADKLFASAAKCYMKNTIGVVLTGMGKDGTDGCGTIKKYKGITIAQSEDSCLVYGMPRAAVEKGVIDKVVPLNLIAKKLKEMV